MGEYIRNLTSVSRRTRLRLAAYTQDVQPRTIMETPRQLLYGFVSLILGSLFYGLISIFIVFLTSLGDFSHPLVALAGVVTFLGLWWGSYLLLIRFHKSVLRRRID